MRDDKYQWINHIASMKTLDITLLIFIIKKMSYIDAHIHIFWIAIFLITLN